MDANAAIARAKEYIVELFASIWRRSSSASAIIIGASRSTPQGLVVVIDDRNRRVTALKHRVPLALE